MPECLFPIAQKLGMGRWDREARGHPLRSKCVKVQGSTQDSGAHRSRVQHNANNFLAHARTPLRRPPAQVHLEMEHEFGHMVSHEWQRRLLVASSCCFLLVAGVAHLSFAKTELACVMSCVGAASLNYWRAPGPSWRRPIDLGCAAFGMSYNSVHGWFVVQNTWANAIGWTAHTLGPRPR